MTQDNVYLSTSAVERRLGQSLAQEDVIQQTDSQESLQELCEQTTNPWAADQAQKEHLFKSLNERKPQFQALQKKEGSPLAAMRLEQAANEFHSSHPELSAQTLITLLRSLDERNNPDELLKQVRSFFPDATLSDDALTFLIAHSESPLKEKLQLAQSHFQKQFGRQIVAGRNIALQAQAFSQQGLGTTTTLRDLYRDITGNPREPPVLFDELARKYSFNQLKTVIQFLLHALGGDLRSKGPSIEPGELARLFTEARSLQAILGTYKFFQSRMELLSSLFTQAGQTLPKMLTFEVLARAFIHLLDDRFPNANKIRQSALQLGTPGNAELLIALISQWRDAIRNVSPRLYRTLKQRDDLLGAILQSLDDLEEEVEEKEENSDQQKKKKKQEEEKEKDKKKQG